MRCDAARAIGASAELQYVTASPDVLFEGIRRRDRESPHISLDELHRWLEMFEHRRPTSWRCMIRLSGKREMVEIDECLVRALVADQFPMWAELTVRPVPQSGWDNRTFLLGDEIVVRLPSAEPYAAQVDREQRSLPRLRAHLPVDIPEPLALGRPGCGYRWPWSVYRWIRGETASVMPPTDVRRFALDLASFLNALRELPAAGGPEPGSDNFHRGGSLAVYDDELRRAISSLGNRIDGAAALTVWNAALASRWSRPPVWVHGDVAPGNLLVRDGRLAAVIDFGQVGVGDPACDLAIAWTYFRQPHRRAFRVHVGLDSATWQRGLAWALWKAAIVAAGIVDTNTSEQQSSWLTLDEVLNDAGRPVTDAPRSD